MRRRPPLRAPVWTRRALGTTPVRRLWTGPRRGGHLSTGSGPRFSARRSRGHAGDDERVWNPAHPWLLRLIHFADRWLLRVRAPLQRTPLAWLGRVLRGHWSCPGAVHRTESRHGRFWSAPVRHGCAHLGMGGGPACAHHDRGRRALSATGGAIPFREFSGWRGARQASLPVPAVML